MKPQISALILLALVSETLTAKADVRTLSHTSATLTVSCVVMAPTVVKEVSVPVEMAESDPSQKITIYCYEGICPRTEFSEVIRMEGYQPFRIATIMP